jgi:hypothetical protein
MLVETYPDPRVNMRAKILDGVSAPTNGEWCKTEGYDKYSVHVVKEAAATLTGCQVYVSNEVAPAADGGVTYGSAVTASALIEVKIPVRWIRLAIGGLSGGKVSAYLEGV